MKRTILIILSLLMIFSISGCVKKVETNEEVNLYPAFKMVERSKLWGYIDHKGEFAIEAKYNNVGDFTKEGAAIVERMNSKGLINTKGEEVVQIRYQEIIDLNDGYFVAYDGKALHLYNHKGDLQFTSGEYVFVGPHSEGLFATGIHDENGELLMGYLDKSGKIIIEPKYMRVNDFRDGKAVVMVDDNLFHFIDKKGETVKELEYALVVPSGDEKLYLIRDKDNKYGYLDEEGNILVEPKFIRGELFQDGQAIVGVEGGDLPLYGVIDTAGEYIIHPEYRSIISLDDGYYGVAKERDSEGYKYGIANNKGELITEFLYYGLSNKSSRDVISVFDGKETYAIDTNGKKSNIIPTFEGRGKVDFYEKTTKATLLSRIYYYDSKGKLIWEESNDYLLKEGAQVLEKQYKSDSGINIYYPVIEGIKNKEAEEKINEELYSKFVTEVEEEIKKNSDKKYDYYNTNYTVRKFHDLLTIQQQSEFYIEGETINDNKGAVYNISLRTGEFFTLEDLFKKDVDYTKVLSEHVSQQVGMEIMQGRGMYDMKNFKGVEEDQDFIPQLENIVLFFNPSEIKSDNTSFPVFTISQQDLSNILDMESEFWWTYTVNRGF